MWSSGEGTAIICNTIKESVNEVIERAEHGNFDKVTKQISGCEINAKYTPK